MTLAAGPKKEEDNESDHSPEAVTPEHSDHEQPIVKLPNDPIARADRIGTSVPVEAVVHTVEVAEEVEPEIAKDAQEDLDRQEKQSLKAQILAAKNLSTQQERRPEDVKKSEAELQGAKDQLRKQKGADHVETSEEHIARLAQEEKARLAAQKQAPVLEGQLAKEAVEKIAPKLPKIQQDAANAQAQREAALAEQQAKAAELKKQEQLRQQEQDKKAKAAEDQARKEAAQFIGSAPSGPKTQITPELLAKLNATKAELVGVKAKTAAYEQGLMTELVKAPVQAPTKDPAKPNAALTLLQTRQKQVADEAAANAAAAQPEEAKPARRSTRIAAIAAKFNKQ